MVQVGVEEMGPGEVVEVVGVGGVVRQALFGVAQFDAGAGGFAEAAQEGGDFGEVGELGA